MPIVQYVCKYLILTYSRVENYDIYFNFKDYNYTIRTFVL